MMEAAISALSTGPVQPSDAIGYSNATLIGMTCTRTSGTLLQPSRPATAIDACFGREVYGDGYDGPVATKQHNYPVMSTHTEVSGTKWMSTIVINLNQSFALKRRHVPLDVDASKRYIAWTGYGKASNVTGVQKWSTDSDSILLKVFICT